MFRFELAKKGEDKGSVMSGIFWNCMSLGRPEAGCNGEYHILVSCICEIAESTRRPPSSESAPLILHRDSNHYISQDVFHDSHIMYAPLNIFV